MREKLFAWAVHGYTASGLIAAAGMAVCIFRGDAASFNWAIALMILATFIDSTDGWLARRARVKEVVPQFDGRRLDDIVDFQTYTSLPILFIWRAGILPEAWSLWLLVPLLAILERDPDALVWILPSDHWVRDEETVAGCARAALGRVAAEPERIVLMGIEPDAPDTQYGWILPEERDTDGFAGVTSFVEKPHSGEARRLQAAGAVWNSFLLVASARSLVRLYERRLPGLLATLRRAVAARDLASVYAELPSLDFSKDVLQGAEDCLLVQRVPSCGWSDLGTPERLRECLHALRADATAGDLEEPSIGERVAA